MAGTDRKHQLLETALDVFSRQGYEGATTKEIAAAAGVAEAVIFRHFPSKQALYTEVLDYKLQSGALNAWLADIQACIERDDDEGLFRTIIAHMLESFRAGARFERMILFAALEGHELGLAHLRQHSQPFFESLHSYVRGRHAAGALCARKPQHILMALFGMVHHYGQMTQMFGFPLGGSDEEMADAFVSILMDGVRPRREQEEARSQNPEPRSNKQ
jgi:TetR/AcrR family transcriptional regulator